MASVQSDQTTAEMLSKAIENAIMAAIEEQVRAKMPEIVGAACASVVGRLDQFVNLTRMGNDLRITVLNAYKAVESL